MSITTGASFGIALCEHFGLKHVLGDITLNTKVDEVFSASLTIMLTADDLAAIGKRMGCGSTVTIVNNTAGMVAAEFAKNDSSVSIALRETLKARDGGNK